MSDFLLELASEEIPARMQAAAAEQLRTRFVDGLKAAGLAHGEVIADVTPRRLWLIARDVAGESAAASEERKGPSASAPEAAIAGFLRSTGLRREDLEERQTPKGMVLFAHIQTPGRSAAEILAELVPAIVRDFAWPKSMRWGAASAVSGSPRWVRPLTGIVALLDGHVVPFEVFGVASGRVTRGHRIHAPDALSVGSAGTYEAQLRDAKVIAASGERRLLIESHAAKAAAAKGLTVIPDAGLVAENAGLTEWPVPMLGAFDPAFLAVPREVIQLTMRTNQKYFACADAEGALAPAFVCVANLEASDGGAAIVAGNERVLSARLADAKFFWDQDLKAGLESFLPKLSQIVFHEKLGTVADKVDRVAKLARWLVESGAVGFLPLEGGGDSRLGAAGGGGHLWAQGTTPTRAAPSGASLASPLEGEERRVLADLAEQAARLCKADLVSATVGEFPEVQGIAGAYLARAEGLDARVADAIRDHYKPVGQGDDVPTAPVSVAVALADKLDTLVGFFDIDEKPTGSRDPFALRRAALGIVALLLSNDSRISLVPTIEFALSAIGASRKDVWLRLPKNASSLWGDLRAMKRRAGFSGDHDAIAFDALDFLADRLKVQQREAGIRHDLIDAVFVLGGEDDLIRLLARVRALQAFVATDDGLNLLAAYKRAANILRIETAKDGPFDQVVDHGQEVPAEIVFRQATAKAIYEADTSIKSEDFGEAMRALAEMRVPVDAFFEAVLVNDPINEVRRSRLALLARFRDAVHTVADFSKIEG